MDDALDRRLMVCSFDSTSTIDLPQGCDLHCEPMPYVAYNRLNLPIPGIMLGYKRHFTQNTLKRCDIGELGFLPRARNRRQRGRGDPLRVAERILIGGLGHPLLDQLISLIAGALALDCRHGIGSGEVIRLFHVRHQGRHPGNSVENIQCGLITADNQQDAAILQRLPYRGPRGIGLFDVNFSLQELRVQAIPKFGAVFLQQSEGDIEVRVSQRLTRLFFDR